MVQLCPHMVTFIPCMLTENEDLLPVALCTKLMDDPVVTNEALCPVLGGAGDGQDGRHRRPGGGHQAEAILHLYLRY